MEQFTEDEKKLIKPFFTNLDKSIFAITNLPEVVKGALFSRYSRSGKSLRRMLLDEFINAPEMSFKDIVGIKGEQSAEQFVAVKKAEEFYDRVLVGYGDDSVAELGGASIACEDVSILTTKILEDSRIGLSPLEKSTRYVFFNEKVDGKYRYYVDPDIMKSEFGKDYIEACDFLFDTYSNLVEPMKEFMIKKFPKDEATSDRAYAAAIRAKACDILRVLLPASTVTNVGIYGNGRAFEYLITKMLASPLKEFNDVAMSMHEELSKVIPSFVKRSVDRYGLETRSFISETQSAMWKLSNDIVGNDQHENVNEVELSDFDSDGEVKVIAAILYSYSHLPMSQLIKKVKAMPDSDRKKIIKEYLGRRANRRHKFGRALENTYYTFDMLADFGIYRDLHRHRALTQERQLLDVKHGFVVPKELIEAGFQKEYEAAMKKAKDVFLKLKKVLPMQAQYVVPLGFRIRWYMKMNAREVCHLTELRASPQGHPAYRKVAQEMFKKMREVHPNIAEFVKFIDMKDYELERLEAEKRLDKKMEELNKKYGS